MKKIRILSIDGGGIRGILPGIVLSQIEKKLQEKTGDPDIRLSDMFDFMAGTSTGGILTLAYLTPNEKNRPKYSADDAVNIYLDRGDKIFSTSIFQKVISLGGIAEKKYNASEFEKALEDTFGNIEFSDLLKPCIISSYDITNGKPHFFKQHKSKSDIYNFNVKDIARATSAAPTYFEPAFIRNKIEASFSLIDGGVFINNPALAAYSEVRTTKFKGINHFPTLKDIMIVSIGTGAVSKEYEYDKTKKWGAIGWVKPIIEIMMTGNSQTVNYHLMEMFGVLANDEDSKDYYRLEPKVVTADLRMDNASLENLKKLKNDALNYVSDEDVNSELDIIVEKLINYN